MFQWIQHADTRMTLDLTFDRQTFLWCILEKRSKTYLQAPSSGYHLRAVDRGPNFDIQTISMRLLLDQEYQTSQFARIPRFSRCLFPYSVSSSVPKRCPEGGLAAETP